MRVVFTNGVFDVLHRGHIDYLEKARRCGDVLIVGLNTDASVRRLKGTGRPLQGQQDRALNLLALRFVDYVVLFKEDTPEQLIALVRPDVLVKGADYRENQVVGGTFVHSYGGRVVLAQVTPGHSTTATLARLGV